MRIFAISTIILLSLLALARCNRAPGEGQSAEAAPLTEADRERYLREGQEIAQATFAALSGRLARAMQEGGVGNALEYCNLAAYPLVDSLSAVHGAVIRRTSLKVRNPRDEATAAEWEVLKAYEESEAKGEDLKARVLLVNGEQAAFYAPIRIQPLCLQCHGKVGEDISVENYAIIRRLYPGDEATGYELNDLRGMWSISFLRNSPSGRN